METANLGRTGLEVSRICLGTMQFGWTADRDTSFEIMDAYRGEGGNFLDTADVYSRWAEGNEGGVSEKIIGEWMSSRKVRDQVVLATKVRGRMWDGPNGEGLSRLHIMRAVDDSLRRLGTDRIDLYQTHFYDEKTPIDETMRALDDLVTSGKVLYVGCSNYTAWRLAKALWTSDVNGWCRYDSLQPHYNLVWRREFEAELQALCDDQGIGVIPYSPLQGGFLTGKYRRDSPLPESRRAEGLAKRFMTDQHLAVVDALQDVAEEHGATIAQTAIAWLLANPVVTSPIIGANTVDQLMELLPAVELELTPDQLSRLGELTDWRSG